MLDDLRLTIDYESYYEQCRPKLCSYTMEMSQTMEIAQIVQTKRDIASIIGLVIGIIGGIITILQLIIPRSVKLIIGGV
ncbi:hypothetical protein I4U23_005869 [Adineta vaga]|nr:hypothetical protein I4U23_005869 [Adineta vaga]